MKISKKKHLEMILENVPNHPNPKVGLEQYSTPATIAADLVWNAYGLGDIDGMNILTSENFKNFIINNFYLLIKYIIII